MEEVTKEEFYRVIRELNALPEPTGRYPYTYIFKTPEGIERGRAVGHILEGKGLVESRYYLPKR